MESEFAALAVALVIIVWAFVKRPKDDGPEEHKRRER